MNGQFQYPCGVAFDSDDCFYITEHRNHRVQKLSVKGNYLLQFGSDKLKLPEGITTLNNKVYVAYFKHKHIVVFDTDGQFCTSFGSKHLSGPTDVAVSKDNQLLVLDSVQGCIFTFTLDGKCVGKLVCEDLAGVTSTLLVRSSHGFVLVADCGNHRVSIFDKFGNYVD